MKNNKGFTLVELLVTILAASLITAAATTVLLLGMRINKQTNEISSEQNVVRIGLSVLEDMAAEQCAAVEGDTVKKADGTTLFNYSDNKVYVGGNVLLDKVQSFTADFDQNTKVLTLKIKVNDEEYETSVYCRTAPDATEPQENSLNANHEAAAPAAASAYVSTPGTLTLSDVGTFENRARQAFLNILTAEEGSTGLSSTGEYYSEWYIGSYEENPAWNADTPWCACFLSWALDQCDAYLKEVPRFAHVDKFLESFDENHWKTEDPKPGDIIFFDWIVDAESIPQHVGAVVSTDGETVYTIEGNTNGKVAFCSYDLQDPRILGYGELKWK